MAHIQNQQEDEWGDWEDISRPPTDWAAFDAELDEAIQSLETIQSELHYQTAQSTLSQLVQRLNLTPRERSQLDPELQQMQSILDKLEHQVVHIAVFGMVSRGKSSLLNALLGKSVFETGATHGVTRQQQQASWQISETDGIQRFSLAGMGQSRIELVDTPGLDEIAGDERAAIAHTVAKQADLILFVVAGDLTRLEHEALSQLCQAKKPILLVFNKSDQYPEADRQALYQTIRDERVKALLSPDDIVMAAAAPLVAQPVQQADGSWRAELIPAPPQIEALKLKILDILDRDGKALIALNTLLYADDLNAQMVTHRLAIRDRQAQQIIWQSVMAKALAIALNPVAVLDLIGSAGVDIALIVTLSKLYGLPMTQQDAVGLLRTLAITMGGVSLTELLTTLGLSSLKSAMGAAAPVTGGLSLLPYLSLATAQAGVAGVSTYVIGQLTKVYLAKGATWGSQSPKAVVEEILATLDQPSLLNRIKTELGQRHPTRSVP